MAKYKNGAFTEPEEAQVDAVSQVEAQPEMEAQPEAQIEEAAQTEDQPEMEAQPEAQVNEVSQVEEPAQAEMEVQIEEATQVEELEFEEAPIRDLSISFDDPIKKSNESYLKELLQDLVNDYGEEMVKMELASLTEQPTDKSIAKLTVDPKGKIKFKFEQELEYFPRKAIDTKASKFKPGTELIVKKLADLGPTGTNVYSVQKEGSTRVYYTYEELVQKHGLVL
jgi:hypothetical protein